MADAKTLSFYAGMPTNIPVPHKVYPPINMAGEYMDPKTLAQQLRQADEAALAHARREIEAWRRRNNLALGIFCKGHLH